jgi:hypothetical protein
MKTIPPKFLERLTHPFNTTIFPTSPLRNPPQVTVRLVLSIVRHILMIRRNFRN